MKLARLFVLVSLLTLISMSCKKQEVYQNSAHDRMMALAEQFKSNPKDSAPLAKLKDYAAGSNNWDRYYAYSALQILAIDNVGQCQDAIIPLLVKAIGDADPALRREVVSTIGQIGTAAVEPSLGLLLSIVNDGKEDDVTWFSAESLGKLEAREKALGVLAALLKAASSLPPPGTPDEAPQLRYYALDGIVRLARGNNLDVISELERIMQVSKSPYNQRVAKSILKIDPKNIKALQELNVRR